MLFEVEAVKNVGAAGGVCYVEWKLKMLMQLLEYVM